MEAIDTGAISPAQDIESPAQELGTKGPDVVARVRDAIGSLGLGTDPALNAGTTLKRSERFWAAVAPAKRELLERVRVDMGGVEDAPETLLGLQDAYCEARLFRTSMFLRLVDSGGAITVKGKCRALYTAYLGAVDREMKLAQVLGLTRRAKRIDTVSDLVERG